MVHSVRPRALTVRPCALTAALAILALACGAPEVGAPEPAEEPETPETPVWSVQLHVHGSFSEGVGSIDSHSFEAADLGVDVIWWSDHDFRIGSYRHVSHFGFEGETEPLERDEPWSPRSTRETGRRKGIAPYPRCTLEGGSHAITEEDAVEGRRSLRVRAASAADDFRCHLLFFETERDLQIRPLAADVTLDLAVRPESCGPDARALVELTLSEHAPRKERDLAFEPIFLRYVLEEEPGEPRREGQTYTVPLPCAPGEWSRLSLPVTRDAHEGFPFLVAGDDSLHAIAFGVETRRGAEAAALFDALRIEQESRGEASFRRQAEVIGRVAAHHPGIRQLQGVELSYTARHLNEYSVDTHLLDYDRLAAESGLVPEGSDDDGAVVEGEDFEMLVKDRAVAAVHARGGLVSYNHPFGALFPESKTKPLYAPRTKEGVLEFLLRHDVFGVDLLEVGYRNRGGHPLEDHLWVWDQLALRGHHLVGTGVSDSHGGPRQRWRTAPNNFVSWIEAPSPEKADLIEGMRAGRVFFGDIALFDGRLDLRTDRGFRMGQLVLSDRGEAMLHVEIDGLAAGDRVHVVESGRRAPAQVADGAEFRQTYRVRLPADRDVLLRVEVYDARGRAKLFSNPLAFLREAPPGGIPSARAAIDAGGCTSRGLRGFTLVGAEAETLPDGRTRLRITGGAGDGGAVDGPGAGRIALACGERGAPAEVRFEGLAGSWSAEGSRVELRELAGSGSVALFWP